MSALATTFGRNVRQLTSNTVLSEDQIRRVAPSVFAEGAHESRSARYSYIPTGLVLRGLSDEGFLPFSVAQSATRKEGAQEHTKHLIRLRHADSLAKRQEDVNEIILINSHNGTSSYQMLAGVFRFVCCNGMVVGQITNDVRVAHKGDVQARVIEGAHSVLKQFAAVDESKNVFKSLELSPGEQTAFARAALTVRYNVETPDEAPVTADQILRANRWEDQGDSLWTTLQRVQENTTQGGQRFQAAGTHRRSRTRAVTGIDSNVSLNRALWVLAEELKKARA